MFKAQTPIGVDIGSNSVKVCQLRRVGDLFELERFGMADIFPQGERPSDPQQVHALKCAALKKALDEGQIKARHTISAVCGESIIVRYLQLPKMPEDELKKALQWEAEEYIPFRLSEVNLDSVILGEAHEGDMPKMDVLLVSAKKDMVNSHVQILQSAGLSPKIVDVDSFAFLNCFEISHEPAKNETIALVNIGGEITSISIYTGGVSRFSRDIPLGGDTMTEAIRAHLGCSFAEAERLKLLVGAPPLEMPTRSPDDTLTHNLLENIRGTVEEMSQAGSQNSPEDMASRAVQTTLRNLVSEVRRSVEFFENQYRGLTVSRVVLGGGSAQLKNLQAHFEADLNLPAEVIDALRKVRLNPRFYSAEQVQGLRHRLAVSIGLGIRGLLAA